jgi:hypothetical protein
VAQSYVQYQGDGTSTTFTVPFPFIVRSHVKLYLGYNVVDRTFDSELTEGPDFSWTSDTIAELVSAPASTEELTIIRVTPSGAQVVPWQDGSNLIAFDLNTSDQQNLYVVQEQEDRNDAGITQSTSAITAANAATAAASAATSAASSALSTANTALSNSSAAISTANTAASDASAAVSTANTAAGDASAAVSTANTAAGNASNAVSTANSALSTANSASAAVASAVIYTPVADLAALQALTPSHGDFFELQDSTGADADPDVTGVTAGLTGATGLTFRLRYDDPPQQYVFLGYFANDSETRYAKLTDTRLTDTRTPTDGTVTDAKVASNAAIADTKLATIVTAGKVSNSATSATSANTASAIVARDSSGNFTAGTITAALTGNAGTATKLNSTRTFAVTGDITGTVSSDLTAGASIATSIASSVIVDADVNASAAIAGTKISPDFGSQNIVTTGTASAANILYNRRPALHRGPLFTKPTATTLDVVAGSVLNGHLYATATAVTMPSHTNNTDYAIWQNPTTGALVGDASFTTAPAGATGGSVVGGYHYIPSGRPTAVNNGSPTGAAEILEFSIWDLTWRPSCPDPRGMACIEGGFWMDLYLCGATSYAGSTFSAVPSSRISLTIADGSSPPLVPAQYGGNGSTAYANGKWYVFAEVSRSFGKRLPTYSEFAAAAFGAPEAGSRGTDPGTVIWERVSKFGLAQATGTLWTWAEHSATTTQPAAWTTGTETEGRGQVFGVETRALFLGGGWGNGSDSGSRCAAWSFAPWSSDGAFGARFVAGHLILG